MIKLLPGIPSHCEENDARQDARYCEGQRNERWLEVGRGFRYLAGRIFVDMTGDLDDPDYFSERVVELEEHMRCILGGDR